MALAVRPTAHHRGPAFLAVRAALAHTAPRRAPGKLDLAAVAHQLRRRRPPRGEKP